MSNSGKKDVLDAYNQGLRDAAEKLIDKTIVKAPISDESLSLDETKTLLYELQVQKIELEMQNKELRSRQEEVYALSRRYINLYNESPVGYMTLDGEGKIIDANETAFELLERDRKTLLDQPITAYIFSEDQDIYYLYRKNYSEYIKGQSCDLRMLKKDGTPFFVSLTSKMKKEMNGRRNTYVVIKDISEEKRKDGVLKANERMMLIQSRFAVMGEMISMIAHQWRQPLSVISVTVSGMKIRQELGKYEKEYFDEQLENINLCTRHMSETIDDFRNFYKDDKTLASTNLPTLVKNTLDIIKPILQNNEIKLSTEYLNEDEIFIYQNEFKQVLLSILKNAQEVIVQRKIKDPTIKIKTYREADKYCISIQDNAGGIADNVIDRIFEPYFTTKESYNGTGLGLYMSKIIINEHCEGNIEARNSDGGALFVISVNKTIVCKV